MINTRYVEDHTGIEYHRIGYTPANEDDRRTTNTVRRVLVKAGFTIVGKTEDESIYERRSP
jgi:hypothetical protein